jgi:ribosome-binding factor A
VSEASDRGARVGERIRAELMALFLRGAVKDPRASETIVQAVRMTPDLREARVYVRALTPLDEAGRRRLLSGLRAAKGFLRREVGKTLRLRHAPDLAFHWDDTPEEAARVEQLLAEVRTEDAGRVSAEEE